MRYTLSLLFFAAFYACKPHQTDDCTELTASGDNSQWYILLGADSTTPNFPDYYANYFVYNFDRRQIPHTGIRIDGVFGDARYISYNVYNFSTGLGQSTIIDHNIKPNACSNNPFTTSNNPDLTLQNYTLWVVPESMQRADSAQNVLTYPDDVDTVSIFFRYYVPVGDAYAGVPLPSLSAFDVRHLSPQPLPKQIARNFEKNIDELVAKVESFLSVQIDTLLRFYNVNAAGMFTNLDAGYLATPITIQPDEVYMFRFLAPTFAQTPAQFGNTDVRYWSINIGDGQTHIRYALKDKDAIIAQDGFVNVVIAADTPENRNRAAGLNFIPIPVPVGEPIGVIYRNLIPNPNFTGNIANVPYLDTIPVLVLLNDAQYHIGNYAPRGVRLSTQEYLQNFGGFPVSY